MENQLEGTKTGRSSGLCGQKSKFIVFIATLTVVLLAVVHSAMKLTGTIQIF